MCGVKRSAVRKLRQTRATMLGDSSEKQQALLAGILGCDITQLQHMPKWVASSLIDSVASNENTPVEDRAEAGPYGVYDKTTRKNVVL